MRRLVLLALVAGCRGNLDGDVQMVAVDGTPITLSAAHAQIDAWLVDDCQGSTQTLLVGDEIDLVAAQTQPETIPAGEWCGIGVQFAPGPSLHLEGVTAQGTQFVIDLDPGLVVLAADYVVDGEDWVLVLDGHVLLDPAVLDDLGPDVAIAADDPEADDILEGLHDSLWFGPVWQARDDVYIDLWPFPDVTFEIGFGDIHVGGCNYNGGVDARDLDGDGLVGADDDDDDGDAIPDADDGDRDGDGVDDGSDADGGSGGSTTGDGNGGTGGSGGCDGGSGSGTGGGGGGGGGGGSTGGGGSGCSGGGSSGCGGGGSSGGGSSGGSGCGGSSGGSGCGGGGGGGGSADCGGSSACATLGFGPPGAWVLAAVLLARRRRPKDASLTRG